MCCSAACAAGSAGSGEPSDDLPPHARGHRGDLPPDKFRGRRTDSSNGRVPGSGTRCRSGTGKSGLQFPTISSRMAGSRARSMVEVLLRPVRCNVLSDDSRPRTGIEYDFRDSWNRALQAPTDSRIPSQASGRRLNWSKLLAEMHEAPILLTPACAVPAFRHSEREWTIDGEILASWMQCVIAMVERSLHRPPLVVPSRI